LPYRRCVGLMLLNRHGKVLVAQRNDVRGEAWQMPQGGIDADESPRAAAMRELKEEIGTDKAEIIAESSKWLRYDLPPEIAPREWRQRFCGQEQKWFVLRYLGEDSDINLATKKPEFSAWKWVDISCLPDLIIGFKRPIYLELVKLFSELAKAASDSE
jgi:putative (di)nucleoside polyphosphate hydrolase